MSDVSTSAFGKFIPGFDFLQKLASAGPGAAGPVPGLGNWVAPTVSVEELDKRIAELKAVLFWLEQNTTALRATIQALEVQKMTLSALAGMNLSMAEVAKAFTLPTPDVPSAAAAPVAASAATPGWPFGATAEPVGDAAQEVPAALAEADPEPEPEAAPEPGPESKPTRKRPAAKASAKTAAPGPGAGLADPMQWWGALTQQFQQIAAKALHEAARMVPAAEAGPAASADEPPASAALAPPARKPAAGKRAAKKASAKTARKTPAKSAKKAAPRKPAAAARTDPAAKPAAGWPLPPPFKLGR